MNIPPKVKAALEHVISIYPDVCMVIFNSDTRWQYVDDCFNAPSFDERIDVGILEDAVYDLVDLPCVYELFD
jgi:hypothetical protein